MNAHVSAAKLSGQCRNLVQDELQRILRAAQVRFTDDELSELSGIGPRALRCYRTEGKEPVLSRALALLCVLGTSDLNRILNLIGYVARPTDESDRLECGEALATTLSHVSAFASFAADGRIDHTEEPHAKAAADGAIEALVPYSSLAGAV